MSMFSTATKLRNLPYNALSHWHPSQQFPHLGRTTNGSICQARASTTGPSLHPSSSLHQDAMIFHQDDTSNLASNGQRLGLLHCQRCYCCRILLTNPILILAPRIGLQLQSPSILIHILKPTSGCHINIAPAKNLAGCQDAARISTHYQFTAF